MPNSMVALLRGINVGRAKRVAMADLRSLVERLGFGDVRTLLNSGNLIFTSTSPHTRAIASQIQNALLAELGVSSRVTVLSAAQFQDIMAANPLVEIADNFSRLLVAVVQDPADLQKLQPLLADKKSAMEFALGSRAAYLWCPDGILASPLAEEVARRLGETATTRNWATMLKILEKLGGPK